MPPLVHGRSTAARSKGEKLTPGAGGETLRFSNSGSNRLSNNLIFNSDVDLPDSGATVRFQSGATWTGAATLSGSSTLLAIEDTRTLDHKTINLDAAFGTARLTIEGNNTLTVGPNMLVRGQGTIASGRFVGGDQEVINEGTIRRTSRRPP